MRFYVAMERCHPAPALESSIRHIFPIPAAASAPVRLRPVGQRQELAVGVFPMIECRQGPHAVGGDHEQVGRHQRFWKVGPFQCLPCEAKFVVVADLVQRKAQGFDTVRSPIPKNSTC